MSLWSYKAWKSVMWLTILLLSIFSTRSVWAAAGDHAGCLPQLEKALCYSDRVEHWVGLTHDIPGAMKSFQERSCYAMPAEIRQTVVDIYNAYPEAVQQAFCEIKKLFVVRGNVPFGATADYYFDVSSVTVDEGEWNLNFSAKPLGYILEISEQNRFKGESTAVYLTRVLQARFGGVVDKKTLPVAEITDSFGTNGALASTLVHEIGHMLGRAQKVTSTYFLPLSEGAWSKISFQLTPEQTYGLKYASSGFAQRLQAKNLNSADIAEMISFFKKSGIATLYGASNPQEDFAEMFMFHYFKGLKWKIAGKTVLDLDEEVNSNPAFKAKTDTIQKLLAIPEAFSLKNRNRVSGGLNM